MTPNHTAVIPRQKERIEGAPIWAGAPLVLAWI